MLSLQGQFEQAGGAVAFETAVTGLRADNGGIVVTTGEYALSCNWLINCGGLQAPSLARHLDEQAPQAFYARGHYYSYRGRPPFTRLVYPIAQPGGLGVHVTVDMAGQIKFGPDVEWVDTVDYRFDDRRREDFARAIACYFPAVEVDRLEPGYVGVRPKISGPGDAAADFRIDGPEAHGVDGLINLLGIESPGLTASLAIAEMVAGKC
jgi:D-amino-acid oxidase